MNIEPLAGRVVIEKVKAGNRTPGGIFIPDNATEKRSQKGKVVSVGEGKLLDNGTTRKIQVKKNDIVLFTDYAGTDIEMDSKNYLIVDEQEIIAVLI